MISANPAIAVWETNTNRPVEKRLNTSGGCAELIRFLNLEIPRPNVDAPLMNLVEYSSRREGGNAGIKTKMVRVMRKFICELIP